MKLTLEYLVCFFTFDQNTESRIWKLEKLNCTNDGSGYDGQVQYLVSLIDSEVSMILYFMWNGYHPQMGAQFFFFQRDGKCKPLHTSGYAEARYIGLGIEIHNPDPVLHTHMDKLDLTKTLFQDRKIVSLKGGNSISSIFPASVKHGFGIRFV